MLFQENDSSSFSTHTLLKCKIGLPNLDFKEFFCGKRLMHTEKHVKICLFIEFKENSQNRFLAIHFLSHFRSVVHHFCFCNFHENLEILSMHKFGTVYKVWFFILIRFRDMKHQIFTLESHTRVHTRVPAYAQNNFQKTLFWPQGNSKCINQVKTQHRKF